MEPKILILRDEDVYKTSDGMETTRNHCTQEMYKAHIVIRLFNDGSYKLLKDRYNTSEREIQRIINPIQINENLLLVI
jgi:hypothetical protein